MPYKVLPAISYKEIYKDEHVITFSSSVAVRLDRKRLKAEKLDLLNQMKQLYCTLEDKEVELRDFIRNYEVRMKENDNNLRLVCIMNEQVATKLLLYQYFTQHYALLHTAGDRERRIRNREMGDLEASPRGHREVYHSEK